MSASVQTRPRNASLEAALVEAKQQYAERNRASADHHESALDAMPGGNTRSVLHYDPFPLTFTRGAEATLWDLDGHAYTDFLSEYTAGIYGHSNPVIRSAVVAAMDQGINIGGHNTLEPRFARAVVDRFKNLELVRFTNSGTEANLLAVSLAVAATGRRKVMVFRGGYHGAVFAFSSGSSINAPFDYVIAEFNATEATLGLIAEHAHELAAVILEPMLGGGGCIAAEPEFLRALRSATLAQGIVLIFDEVMTSRLAPGGLQETFGVAPDLTTLGKYVGGGMSFGAFGGKRALMERFDPRHPNALPHAGTFNNNVLTMAAGIAALTEVYTPEACVALNALGDELRERLNATVTRLDVPMQFKGIGSMLAVHMTKEDIRSPLDPSAVNTKARDLFFFDMLASGFWIARRGMIVLSLPITRSDCDRLVDAVEEFALSRRAVLID